MAAFFLAISVIIGLYAPQFAVVLDPILVGFAVASLGLAARVLGFTLRAEPFRAIKKGGGTAEESESDEIDDPDMVIKKIVETTKTIDDDGKTVVKTRTILNVQSAKNRGEASSDDSSDDSHLGRLRRHSFP